MPAGKFSKVASFIAPTPKTHGPSQKRGQKNCNNQRTRKSAIRLHSAYITRKLHL